MIKRILVCGIQNGTATIFYDVVVPPIRTSLAVIMTETVWPEFSVSTYEVDEEMAIGIPADQDGWIELAGWIRETFKPSQVIQALPVRQREGGKREIATLRE